MTTAKPTQLKPAAPSNPSVGSRSGGVFSRLGIGAKIGLIPLAMALPIGVLLALYVSSQNADLAFSNKERVGVQFLSPLKDTLESLQKHRSSSGLVLIGDRGFVSAEAASRKAVDATLKRLEALSAQFKSQVNISEAVGEARSQWDVVKNQTNAGIISAPGSLEAHTRIISLLQTTLDAVANQSNLILDPDLDSYYTMNSSVSILPDLLESVGRAQAQSSTIASSRLINEAERASLGLILGQATGQLEELKTNLGYAVQGNASLKADLETLSQSAQNETEALVSLYSNRVLNTVNLTTPVRQIYDAGTRALDTLYGIYDRNVVVLDRLIAVRVGQLEQARNLSLLAVVLVLLLVVLLITAIVRSITRPVRQLVEVVEKVGQGDLSQKASLITGDEIGVLARQVNGSIDLLRETNRRNAEELERTQKLQSNIGAFLSVTMDISDGDLTQRGIVSDDVLGNVVDSINVMTEELGYTLKDVKKTADSVNLSSGQMTETTEDIARGAQATVLEVGRVNLSLTDISTLIRQTALSAEEASQLAAQTLSASQEGTKAVQDTLNNMVQIREQVSSVAQRMTSLEARSSDITGVAETLNTIASQINLLSLHALLEAAGAGEAGVRFYTVAGEVRELADSSAEAARQVATLVRSVQADVLLVSQSVLSSQKQVEAGYLVATQTGERLNDISKLALNSARLAQSISLATQEQVKGAAQVQQVAQTIAGIARESNSTVERGQAAAENLKVLAGQLEQNLARFRLPN